MLAARPDDVPSYALGEAGPGMAAGVARWMQMPYMKAGQRKTGSFCYKMIHIVVGLAIYHSCGILYGHNAGSRRMNTAKRSSCSKKVDRMCNISDSRRTELAVQNSETPRHQGRGRVRCEGAALQWRSHKGTGIGQIPVHISPTIQSNQHIKTRSFKECP